MVRFPAVVEQFFCSHGMVYVHSLRILFNTHTHIYIYIYVYTYIYINLTSIHSLVNLHTYRSIMQYVCNMVHPAIQ